MYSVCGVYSYFGDQYISVLMHQEKNVSKNKKMLYVPEGFAHGYLVKSKKSIVSYKCTNSYDPKDEFGIKWNDKDIGIDWKIKSPILSQKDKELPILKNQEALPSY